MFLVLILILIAIALFFVVPPLRGKTRVNSHNEQQANLQATRQRLDDIENEVGNNLIASDQLDSIRDEAKSTLLMEMPDQQVSETGEKSALFHKFWTTVIVICIPVFAFLIYLSVGTPTALVSKSTQQPEEQSQQLEQVIAQLETQLSNNPNDEEGWLVLAQTSMLTKRFDKGVEAMENLYRLKGDTPDVLSRYADAITMANQGRFTEQANQLIEKSLSLDNKHVHTLWLAGVSAYQSEQFDQAIEFFEKAKANTDDAANITQIDELITAASQRQKVESDEQSLATTAVDVKVKIDDSLKVKVNPQDHLFVFAKAAQGPPMPLAVSKHTVAQLPLEIALNDSMAMMPDLKLSGFDQIIISARISKSGEPIAQAGDLQGESDVINPSATKSVTITIDQIVE